MSCQFRRKSKRYFVFITKIPLSEFIVLGNNTAPSAKGPCQQQYDKIMYEIKNRHLADASPPSCTKEGNGAISCTVFCLLVSLCHRMSDFLILHYTSDSHQLQILQITVFAILISNCNIQESFLLVHSFYIVLLFEVYSIVCIYPISLSHYHIITFLLLFFARLLDHSSTRRFCWQNAILC